MIEIAPNVFVQKWADVDRGYLHGSGIFCIDFYDGHAVAVRDPHEIQQTIERWRGISDAPFEPRAQKVPADIAYWMGKSGTSRRWK